MLLNYPPSPPAPHHHSPILHQSFTNHSPIPHQPLTNPSPIPHQPLTNPSPTTHQSLTNHSPTPHQPLTTPSSIQTQILCVICIYPRCWNFRKPNHCMIFFIYTKPSIYLFSCSGTRRHPWYSGSALDFWPTGRAIDPAPGAWFMAKFISFAQVVSGPV